MTDERLTELEILYAEAEGFNAELYSAVPALLSEIRHLKNEIKQWRAVTEGAMTLAHDTGDHALIMDGMFDAAFKAIQDAELNHRK